MAILSPFRAVLYNPEAVRSVQDVVAPPYDVISAEGQDTLYARHPENVIRLELGRDQPGDDASCNRYTRAAQHLKDWLKSGTLQRDAEPAIYPYTIEYRHPTGDPSSSSKVMKGFLSLMELEEFGAGTVLPHEVTRAAAKTDRLNLLQACRANFSPIFSLFSDPEGSVFLPIEQEISSREPRIDFEDDDGFRQRLWAITHPRLIQEVVAALKARPLFIADGHHRYETALRYRDSQRQQAGTGHFAQRHPWDSVLMLCASLEDPGLSVLPTHRVLNVPLPAIDVIREKLHETFAIEEFPFSAGDEAEGRRRLLQALRDHGRSGQAYGLALRDLPRYFLLVLRREGAGAKHRSPRERLDVSVLHTQILSRLSIPTLTEDTVVYTKDDDEALNLVLSGSAEAALLLNPTKVTEVSAVASAGERMPHKSTYFFPKPLTGLVMHVLEGDGDPS